MKTIWRNHQHVDVRVQLVNGRWFFYCFENCLKMLLMNLIQFEFDCLSNGIENNGIWVLGGCVNHNIFIQFNLINFHLIWTYFCFSWFDFLFKFSNFGLICFVCCISHVQNTQHLYLPNTFFFVTIFRFSENSFHSENCLGQKVWKLVASVAFTELQIPWIMPNVVWKIPHYLFCHTTIISSPLFVFNKRNHAMIRSCSFRFGRRFQFISVVFHFVCTFRRRNYWNNFIVTSIDIGNCSTHWKCKNLRLCLCMIVFWILSQLT